MMKKKSMLKGLLSIAVAFTLFSCDKDFNTIGGDIVGEDNFEINKYEFAGLQAGSELTGAVQTNNLPLNSLGIYKNLGFGTAKSNFVTQVALNTFSPTIGDNPQIDSVWVYVPYFSHIDPEDGLEDDEVYRKYILDSVYGGETKFKLKIYENGYTLGDYDPQDPRGVLRHYSNERLTKVDPFKIGTNSNGDAVVNGMPLNTGGVSENDEFYFSKKEHILFKTNQNGEYLNSSGAVLSNTAAVSERVVLERFAPGMWINLSKEFIKKRILMASSDKFVNQNVFQDYFQGLYFETEQNALGEGAMATLDFSKGYIRIEYSYQETSGTPAVTETKRSSLKLNLSGNTINFFDNDYNFSSVGGTDPLIVMGGGKGATGTGDGSVTYIDVFGPDTDADGVPDELEVLRSRGWLINEASLTFFVDRATMGVAGQREPNRLYLYDSKNNMAIRDYIIDATTVSTMPKNNKYVYGGILEKESDKGLKYKFRITEYLKSCIKNDSTNFRLRLAVSEDISNSSSAMLKTPVGNPQVKYIPVSSVMNPLGTVLHGPASNDVAKRLKLEIYYTKPD